MDISKLYDAVQKRLSPKRYAHTLGVEKMAARLGEIFLPDKITELRAAALLHDVAKELTGEEQLELMKTSAFAFSSEDLNTPSAYHAFSAPELIKRDFPEFATSEIISAVLYHTLGDVNMSLFDKIIFISDYIEEGRNYQSCVDVRELLFKLIEDGEDKLAAIDRAIALSIENTRKALIDRGIRINSRSLDVLNAFMSRF